MELHQPIRILQAFVANDKGGLTGYICQNYRFINREKIQFDFLTFEDKKLDFEDEFLAMGAKFYHIPRPSHPVAYAMALKKVLRQNDYAAIHFNMSYANFIPVIIARWLGAKRIIMHSHSTAIDDRRSGVRIIKTAIHKIGRYLMSYMADDYLACSSLAAAWMYPEKLLRSSHYYMAKNAIDVSKYSYNPQIRAAVRENEGIKEDTFVIGHVGRFTYQKNHEFLIDVFKQVHDKLDNSLLLLIGEGPEENQIKEKVESLGLTSSVLFLGRRSDVPRLFQAMDCFVLPSRFEGLPIVGIEAQAAGLPCLFSTCITSETSQIKTLSAFVDLECHKWTHLILSIKTFKRTNVDKKLILSDYNLDNAIRKNEQYYLSFYK